MKKPKGWLEVLCQGQKGGLCPLRKARKVGGHLLTPEAVVGQVLVGKLKNIKRPEGLEGGRKGRRRRERKRGRGKGKPVFGYFPEDWANKCSLERRQKYLSSIRKEEAPRVRTGRVGCPLGFRPPCLSSLIPASLRCLKYWFL